MNRIHRWLMRTMSWSIRGIWAVAAFLGILSHAAADEVKPFPFLGGAGDLDLASVSTNDAAVSEILLKNQRALRVTTGHKLDWPGITIRVPQGHVDLSSYANVTILITNLGTNSLSVSCRVDNPGADGTQHCVTGHATLGPGQGGEIVTGLKRTSQGTLDGKLFGMMGYPAALGGSNTIDPANVTQLIIFTSKPTESHGFAVMDVRAAGKYVPPLAWVTDAEPFFPFIDMFGQYKHKDWPGKTKSIYDLTARAAAEERELHSNRGPTNWDKFGGWADGPSLSSNGFFRTEKVNGRWWLVDPLGHLFFSTGINCMRYGEPTPIEERANWFAGLPHDAPEYSDFSRRITALLGHYGGKSPMCFSFVEANLLRKFGPDWKAKYPTFVNRRLRNWGINTIGNWSDPAFISVHLTAYTDNFGSWGARMIEASSGYWGKFPDVFDPSFEHSVREAMRGKQATSANDPWCLGYFSDNEMSWGDEVSLGLAALLCSSNQAAKQVFIADLKAKYGDIEKLNAAWGTNLVSWDAMLAGKFSPNPTNARADLTAFYTRAAEQYFRVTRDAIKAVAPHQLYLGCRFAWNNPLASAAAAKFCDVVSFNVYKPSVSNFVFNGGADVPLMIGEFHFGALDRGLFSPGLVEEPDQQARAKAYYDYVEGALHHPQFVGCHWFEYHDEAVTGRAWDGENYQIGFVDVADTPYPELIAVARDVGYHLYNDK